MGNARGANASVALAYSTAGYGSVPATGFRPVTVSSIELGDNQDVLQDDSLGRGRNPQDGGDGVVVNEGQAVVGIDTRYIGLWLKGLLGQPTSTQGIAASGSILFTGLPANNSVVTLNGEDVTFVTGTPTAGQVKIGATIVETVANLVAALNASAEAELTVATYRADLDGTSLLIQFDALGTAGNSYTLAKGTSPNPNATLSGATLTGGAATGAWRHVFVAGQVDHPDMAIQIGNPEVPHYGMNRGVMVDSGSFPMQRQGLANATFALVAQKESESASSMAGTLEAEWAWDRFSQFSGVIEVDGVPVGKVESATLRINNNLDKDESIRPDGAIGGADPAMLGVMLDLTARFASSTLRDMANAKQAVTLRMGWTRPNGQSLFFVMDNVRLPRRRKGISGPGGVRVTYNAMAFESVATQQALRAELINDIASY
jgi:Phage tail tube protein